MTDQELEAAAKRGYEAMLREYLGKFDLFMHTWEHQSAQVREDWRTTAKAILEPYVNGTQLLFLGDQ